MKLSNVCEIIMCVHVCTCVCAREREREREKMRSYVHVHASRVQSPRIYTFTACTLHCLHGLQCLLALLDFAGQSDTFFSDSLISYKNLSNEPNFVKIGKVSHFLHNYLNVYPESCIHLILNNALRFLENYDTKLQIRKNISEKSCVGRREIRKLLI